MRIFCVRLGLRSPYKDELELQEAFCEASGLMEPLSVDGRDCVEECSPG